MAIKQGIGGKVMVGANTAANVESWEMQISNETLDTTGLGASGRAFVGRGLPEFTFTVNFKALDLADTATLALKAAAVSNSTGVTLLLYEDGTKYWTSAASSAYIDSYSETASVDGLVTGTISGKVSGVMTYT